MRPVSGKQNINLGEIILAMLVPLFMGITWGCESDADTPPPTQPPPTSNDWTLQPALTNTSLTDIFFTDNSFGWAVGENLILTTSTGGSFWDRAPISPDDQPEMINSIYFVNQQKGWFASGLIEDEGGKALITLQGGAYPVQQASYNQQLNAIYFRDEQTGWAAGADGIVINTTNNGSDWNTVANLGTDLYDIHFTTDQKGWAAGDNGSLFRTNDGVTFIQEELGTDQRLNAVHFTDTLYGWTCGIRNTIFRRHLNEDNQVVWSDASIQQASEVAEWNDIHFIDRLNGWVVGIEGTVYKTTDGGQNWERETIETFETLNAIHMLSSTKGWISGEMGVIFTYTP